MADNSDKKQTLEDLQREQNELRQMIQTGVTFDVTVTYLKRKPGLAGFFKKRERVKEKKIFTIEEPTLSTLDRLSGIWLQLEIDEAKMNDNEYLNVAKQLAAKNAKLLARMVAIAVLGEDFYTVREHAGTFQRRENKKKTKELTSLFYHAVKPSELFTLAVLITNVSNLGDFINSIRLMSATRTSDPTHLIEKQG